MWNVLNDASRNTCNNMWVQIWTSWSDTCFANVLVSKLWTYNSLQVQERVSLMFLHQVLPQCVFIICYLTSQHMTISLRPSLYIENGGREGLEQGLAMQFNIWMKTNVREKEKTCLENIFGLVSSFMPRPPCPGLHAPVKNIWWFDLNFLSQAMSGKCIIIVPRMQFPLLAAWLLCNLTFKQSATFPNHQSISRLWKNWQTFSFQSPTLR